MIEKDGVASETLYRRQFPRDTTVLKRAKAVIECYKEIPCNPCETKCPVEAIQIGADINARPIIDFTRCTGCGICVAICPGLAITLRKIEGDKAVLTCPYELLPRPEKGDLLDVLNRHGTTIGQGRVLKVSDKTHQNKTVLVHVSMDKSLLFDAMTIEVPHET